MSQPRQGFAVRTRHWWHVPLTAILVILSLPVFAAIALALRLWVGPVDVTGTARRLLGHESVPGLTFGRARIAWSGWQYGPSAPVRLLLEDLRLGETRVEHGSISLDGLALLHGRAAITTVSATDTALVLYRDRAGTITLQPTSGDAPHPAASPPEASAHRRSRVDFSRLNELAILRAAVTLHDAATGLACHVAIADLLLNPQQRPAALGVTGDIAAALTCGGPSVGVHAQGWEDPGGGIFWHMVLDPLVPAAFAGVLPELAPLAALDLPVTMSLDTALFGGFGQFMLPRELHLAARMGAGTIRAPAGAGSAPGDPGIAIQQGSLHLTLRLPDTPDGPTEAVLSDAILALAGADAPTLQLGGTLSRTGSRIRSSVQARIARVAFAGLARYWPVSAAHGARSWITSNITAGTGRNLAADADLVSDTGWGGIHLARLSGGLDATGLTLFWLRPIAPMYGMDAHLVLEGPNALRIESRHATEDVPREGLPPGSIAVGPSSMRITGLSQKDQLATIDTHLAGGVQDLLVLLAHPRLRLLSQHPVGFTNPSGAFDAHLTLSLPLIDTVKAEDIPVRVDAKLTDVHLGRVAGGRDLNGADLTVSASNDGLKLQGHGALSGLPSSLVYSMDFRAGPPAQVTESAHVAAQVTEAAIQSEGLDDAHHFGGAAQLGLDYARHRDGAASIALALDLTASELSTPFWRKSAGAAADASGMFGLQDDHLVSIGPLHATGPGLSLDAHADVAGGHPNAVVIEHFAIGRSLGSGRIDLPVAGGPGSMHVALHGAALDISPFISGAPKSAAKPSAPVTALALAPAPSPDQPQKSMPWRADLAFGKVLVGPSRGFDGVTLHAEASGVRISSATLAIDGPTPIKASVSREPNGRRVALDAQDVGVLLAAMGIVQRVEGGVFSLTGRLEDRPAGVRLTALARIGPFTVHDAPLAARLARDLSVYGFLTGAPTPELAVTRFEIPFTLEGDRLQLMDAHASNAALGATLRGPIDLRQEKLDLRGTIVPSYLLNALPGQLPGVGKVFSPEKGGGLLAVTLRITGPIGKPAIRVNPLALLAPGVLRRLLFN